LKPKPKCLKIVKIWRLHPVLLYFCFLTKRTEKSISSAINSSTFSHDFWIRSLLPFEHSGTVGVQPEAMDFNQFYQHKDLLQFVLSLFSCDTQQVPQGKKGRGVYLYTSVIPTEKKDWSLDPIPMKISSGHHIRGASWYVQKCIIPYQLLLLPTKFIYFQLPLWPPYFDEV
jgi:hypothetical protein